MKKIIDRPLISFIVPFYNGEKYAESCVRSIMEQDYKNIEIVLVDDGSTDSTFNVLSKLHAEDDRIRVYKIKNSGVSAARNVALDKVKGDYVCLVDQDDEIEPNYTSYYYDIISKNMADIALTPQPCKFTDERRRVNKNSNDGNYCCSGVSAAEKMLLYKFVIAPWNKMISRDLIEKNKIRFRDELFGGEGFVFSVQCFLAAGKVAVGSEMVYNYRVDNPNSGMTKFSNRIIESSITAQQLLLGMVKKRAPEIENACKYSNWHTYVDCLNMIVGCSARKKISDTEYKNIKKVCKKEALWASRVDIPKKEKLKALLYAVSPVLAAKIINRLRIRKFTNEDN